MRAKFHPIEKPYGVRDPRPPSCQVQSGGKLVWIQDGQPRFWSDRPYKFPAHIRLMLRKRGGTELTDIKWRQLNGKVWWRLPDWPDGSAKSD